jgi:capsular polysaccharide export protein
MVGPEAVDYSGVWAVRSPAVMMERRRTLQFLGPDVRFRYVPPGLPLPKGIRGLAGWGLIGTAHVEARRRDLTYLAMEDGFLRSAGISGPAARRLSLVADPEGVYYDSSRPSRLERLIQAWETIPASDIAEAEKVMALLRQANLGKYNAASDVEDDDPIFARGAPVVVLDQIAGDRSIAGGASTPDTFAEMLDAALAENPGRTVLARVHPMEGQRGRVGHLRALAAARNVQVYGANVSWASLAKRAHRVYVASSQAGLEALILGVPVSCFGIPAYGGWGLTDDRRPCPRRTARPTLAALVAAAYVQYPIYLDPLTDQPCAASRVGRMLAVSRRRDRETEGPCHVVGVQRWKRPAVEAFIKGSRTVLTWTMDPQVALKRQQASGGRIAGWASRIPESLDAEARARNISLVRLEDGFLRSVGLGSRREPPSSLVADDLGIYYDPARLSRLEQLLRDTDFDPALVAEAASLRQHLVGLRLSKYNVGGVGRPSPYPVGADRRRLLVPGQVTDDESVRRGSGKEVVDNLSLLKAVRAARPDGYLLYKPHPDVEAGVRKGALPAEQVLKWADAVATDWALPDLLEQAEEVHTLTSLSGFEALLRGLDVYTYGRPFYAGWGLTRDQMDFERRGRALTLDQLIAGALLLYPRYIDQRSGLPAEAMDVVRELSSRASRGGAGARS